MRIKKRIIELIKKIKTTELCLRKYSLITKVSVSQIINDLDEIFNIGKIQTFTIDISE